MKRKLTFLKWSGPAERGLRPITHQKNQPTPASCLWLILLLASLACALNKFNSNQQSWWNWIVGWVSLICLFFCLLPFGGAPAAGSGHNPPKERKEKTNQSSFSAARPAAHSISINLPILKSRLKWNGSVADGLRLITLISQCLISWIVLFVSWIQQIEKFNY